MSSSFRVPSWRPSARAFTAALAGPALIAACAGLSACSSSGSSSGGASAPASGNSSSSWVVGVTSEFSGTQGGLGAGFSLGFNAAINAANTAGGVAGRKIKVTDMDDASNPTTARSNVTTFNSAGAIAVGGFTASNTGSGAFPLAAQYGIPFLVTTIAGSTLNPSDGFKWIFLTQGLDNSYTESAEVQYAETILKGKPHAKVAIAYIDTPSGVLGDATLKAESQQQGWDVVTEQKLELTGTSVQPAIGAIVNAKPDVVLAEMAAQPEIPVLSGLRTAGYAGPIVNYGAGTSLASLNQLKDPDLVGMRVIHLPNQTQYSGIEQMVGAIKGDPSGLFVEEGYSQGLILIQALKDCGSSCTRSGLLQALDGLKNFNPGNFYSGPVSYTPQSHVAALTYVPYTYKNGQVVQLSGTFTIKP